ncbi:MAG: type II toxin-antitoxin system VapC family toxin [Verrucomicrobia bacterium]|nr:type II toxin-antitoxin system VapC family toxin [Verrucomicrobiota bacterium]
MIYFDTSYILKCYLNEANAELVRALAEQEPDKYSCRWARAEFFSGLKRQVREAKLTATQAGEVKREFESDEHAGVWLWLPVDDSLLDSVAARFSSWPDSVPLRTGDALHLTSAKENGFTEIYSNDKHLLAAAPHFGLIGKNVLPSS